MLKTCPVFIAILFFFFSQAYGQESKFIATSDEALQNETLIQNELISFEGYKFDGRAVYDFFRKNLRRGELELQIGSHNWNIEFIQSTIVSPDVETFIVGFGGKLRTNSTQILTYHGKIQDVNNSRVTITSLNDYIHIVVHVRDRSFVFQPAHLYDQRLARNSYILYQGSDAREVLATCGVEVNRTHQKEENDQPRFFTLGDVHKVKLAIASDYAMFLEKGSVEAVTTHAVTVMNNVANDYTTTDFDEGIQYEIIEQLVSICASCDPWTDSNDPNLLISSFRNWAQDDGFNRAHDMASLWSNRDFDGNTVGLAYRATNLLCGNGAYHVLQDYTADANALRVLVSHEMGHNWNGRHDATGSPTIMAPSISNVSVWSEMSEMQIGGQIIAEGVNCLETEAPVTCIPISDVVVSNITATSVTVDWNSDEGTNTRIRLKEEGNDIYLLSINSSGNSITLTPPLERCKTYQVTVERICGEDYSAIEGAIFQSPHETDFELISIGETNCLGTTHELQIVVEHGGGNPSGFNVSVSGVNYPQTFGVSPQTITITELNNSGINEIVEISANIDGGGSCDLTTSYSSPENCLFSEVINLNDNLFPIGWEVTTTAPDFGDPFQWKVNDASRPVLNYFDDNPTINGNGMFYMDDDVNNNEQYTGTTTLTSPVYDLTGTTSPALTFTYNFHKFDDAKPANNSGFFVEVYDGLEWVEVWSDITDVCAWNNLWNNGCETQASVDLSAYVFSSEPTFAVVNTDFQIRFIYTDGGTGDWTGMIALDDIVVADAAALPVEYLDIAGVIKDGISLLTWQTISEINNDYFILERSKDGENFASIGKIEGAGNSTQVVSYQFKDVAPFLGNNYYRLRQVDLDGKPTFSDIIHLINNGKEKSHILPNPADHEVSVWFYSEYAGGAVIDIIDIQGKRVLSQTIESSTGNNTAHILTGNLICGTYILRLTVDRNTELTKFVIER